ncbi:hypothetical protein [uncultured Thermomonospora sp.]|uniref:hypothetical protein n=1 Tax=uncultured Thermomonospora sp. TaxID=671175 RepID=UPI00259B8AE2|nr:hypothetical protein [uncultured Thermomonospora sp.]
MKRPGPIRVCAECGREREHEAHGLCRTCYTRWRRRAALAAGRVPRIAARVQDYAEVRSLGETRETACARLGISVRTAVRYEGLLRSGWRPPGWEEWLPDARRWVQRLAADTPGTPLGAP